MTPTSVYMQFFMFLEWLLAYVLGYILMISLIKMFHSLFECTEAKDIMAIYVLVSPHGSCHLGIHFKQDLVFLHIP